MKIKSSQELLCNRRSKAAAKQSKSKSKSFAIVNNVTAIGKRETQS